MGSIDLFKQTRGGYKAKEAFDIHSTMTHFVADPLADQLKGAWFCLKNGFFDPNVDPDQPPSCYPVDGNGNKQGYVSKYHLNVYEKGIAKIKENFKAKMYDCFPDLRYQLLVSEGN